MFTEEARRKGAEQRKAAQKVRDTGLLPFIMKARIRGMSWDIVTSYINGAAGAPPYMPHSYLKRWGVTAVKNAAKRLGIPTGRVQKVSPAQIALPGIYPNDSSPIR